MTVDIILLLIIAVGLVLGFKKGFFGVVTKPLKLVASICLTILISSPIINAWTRPFFAAKVENWIYNSLVESTAGLSGEMTTETMPVLLKLFVEILNVDLTGVENAATESILSAIAQQMALPIGNLIAVVVTYALLFIILMLLLSVLLSLADIILTKGWIGKVNKLLGLLLGGVIASVIACIFANICYKISPTFASGAITEFFKNINPFAIVMQI